MSIAVINASTVVSDGDGQTMVTGLNMILPRFCSDWNLQKYTAVYIPKGKSTNIAIKVFLLDTSDVQGALGYHGLSSDVPYGKCFAKTVLDNGGVTLYSPSGAPTLAQCLAHEVFELLVDPLCNSWWDIGDGQTLFARETCDPVESNTVVVTIVLTPAKTTFDPKTRKSVIKPAVVQQVGLSDWILPAWADPQNTKGPFNHMNTLKAPFTLDKGGYGIQITNGSQGQVTAMKFGEAVTDAKKAYHSARGRVTKRTT